MKEIANPILNKIWEDRYKKNNETYLEQLERVARYIASNKEEYMSFYRVMKDGFFFPAGRTMSNSGIGENLTLNNCFVAPQIKDSLDDIFKKVALGAKTHQRGGGIGYDFSKIRPAGTLTSNDAVASGAISFMDVFDAQTATILQGNRRGANMGIMNVYHPDIYDFIYAKRANTEKLKHFNLTVMVDDNFMNAVIADKSTYLHFPVYNEDGSICNDREKWTHVKEIKAKELWDEIIKLAYDNGEPGIAFYDTMNRMNNTWYIENILATNPCFEYLAGTVHGNNPITGEELHGEDFGGACNLGSIFLHNLVKNPFTKRASFDYASLSETVNTAVRMLDNVIDINKYPDKIYENYQKNFRTIGLGVTGLADTLAMLGYNYGDKDAIKFTKELMDRVAYLAYDTSIQLAKEKGSFNFFDNEKFVMSGFLQNKAKNSVYWEKLVENIKEHGIRNARLLSVAPVGTLSLTYGNNCSSGIEPIFSLEQNRKVKMNGQSEEDIKIVTLYNNAYEIYKKLDDIDKVDEKVFTENTTLKLGVDSHLKMLAVIAESVDMSVSKTINVPEEYSFDNVKQIYMDCWKSGIKGCTIFRPNEVRPGIFNEKPEQSKPQDNNSPVSYDSIAPVSRKTLGTTHGETYCKKTACGTLYITLNRDDNGNVVEAFINTSKGGICSANVSAINRMISLALRSGVKVSEIIDQLKGIDCKACTRVSTSGTKLDGISCPDILARTLKEFYESDCAKYSFNKDSKVEEEESDHNKCPDCGATLIHDGGCVGCLECGYSKCS